MDMRDMAVHLLRPTYFAILPWTNSQKQRIKISFLSPTASTFVFFLLLVARASPRSITTKQDGDRKLSVKTRQTPSEQSPAIAKQQFNGSDTKFGFRLRIILLDTHYLSSKGKFYLFKIGSTTWLPCPTQYIYMVLSW